ncbi:MAG: hypothetical protein H0W61_07830 [Bacteroidetes bacterium]|nr:hypothetical protein [Bacteroidota bacterium]
MKFFIPFLFCLISFASFSQQKKNEINDFTVSLHEETVNKVLAAVGDISGANTYEIMFITAPYQWTVKNPKINIRPDSSDFTCDALVNAGPISYKTKVIGHVKITYDNTTNLINIKIARAIFELYTMVFGKKVHIKDIHLEDYFKEPFSFEGPRSMATEMAFQMPDSTMKKIYVQPTECRMELKWKEICTACEVAASDKPFKPVVKVIPPIEATKTATVQPPRAQKK